MKNFVLGFLCAILLGVLGTLGVAWLGWLPVGADATPSGMEKIFFEPAVYASVHRRAVDAHNPIVQTDSTLIAGGKLYMDNCVGCHGITGRPAAHLGATFYPPAPQFAKTGTRYTEAEVHWIVGHGIRASGMSAHGPFYSDSEMWLVAAFTKRIGSLSPRLLDEVRRASAE